MAMSLTEILRKCQKVDIDGAKSVAVVPNKVRKGRGGTVFFTTKTRPGEAGETAYRYHQVSVYPMDRRGYTGTLMACPAVKVSCDCDRFMFTYEVALWKHGAADIVHSNGQLPVTTNPKMVPGCCKHIISAVKFIFKNGL